MSREMQELLSRPDRGSSENCNIHAKLFREILMDRRIDRMAWDRYLRDWMFNPKSGIPDCMKSRSSLRSSINRTTASKKLTWKSLRTGLSIIGAQSVSYKLELKWSSKIKHTVEPPTYVEYIPRGQENELRRMFAILTSMVDMTPQKWQVLLSKYIERVFHDKLEAASEEGGDALRNNSVEISTFRGNVNKSIWQKDNYTWGTFCRALSILGIVEVKMTMIITWSNKKTVHYPIVFNPR